MTELVDTRGAQTKQVKKPRWPALGACPGRANVPPALSQWVGSMVPQLLEEPPTPQLPLSILPLVYPPLAVTYATQPWPEFWLPLFVVLRWPSSCEPWPSVLQFKKISGQIWLLW